MAVFTTTNQNSQKEDLANFISNISRSETPFISSIGKVKATAITHEWSTDTLDTPTVNQNSEGSTFGNPTNDPSVIRHGNRTQIFTKAVRVSGTLETVDKAGRASEFKYQTQKRGTELMRDIELALVGTRQRNGDNTRLNSGFDGSPFSASDRSLGGYQSWVPAANTVNSVVAGTVVAGTAGNGVGTDVATYTGGGTTVNGALSLVQIDRVMQATYENGGMPSVMMLSPAQKRAFSNAVNASGSNVRRNIDDSGKLRQSVEIYESDFGPLSVMKNYVMSTTVADFTDTSDVFQTEAGIADSDIFLYDPKMFAIATLRPLHYRDIREDGDSKRAYMVDECSLQCSNPNASGLIGNIGQAGTA